MASQKFRVIIAGAGVCGLTLANALERAQIDYVLLEARTEIAPFLGASIAINSNGFRILDQLGCYDPIDQQTRPMDRIRTWLPDGRVQRDVDAIIANRIRFGYPFSFMDRHFLLQTLYNNLEDNSKVILGKKVSRVDQHANGVSVQCKDGSKFEGDVVVAADGVHSVVRQEMWRHMDSEEPGLLPESEKTAMTSTYRAIYGVSKTKKSFAHGYFNQVPGYDTSMLYCNDKSGRVFWFLFEKMDKVYRAPNIPRFTQEDAEALARRNLDVRISKDETFADLWEGRIRFTLVPIEEAWYQHWTWGRFVCAGDSIHKWTPNVGAGGNHAIESAAALANALNCLANSKSRPSQKDIQVELTKFHKHRKYRAKAAFKFSNMVTRMEALATKRDRFFVLYIQASLDEFISNRMGLGLVGAEKIEFLPDPPRSLTGTMPFNPDYSSGRPSERKSRILSALPFFVIAYLARTVFSNIISSSALSSDVQRAISSANVQFGDRTWELPTNTELFHVFATVFAPSLLGIDPLQRLQALTFLTDLTPLWFIWILESNRRANTFKFIAFPVVYGIAFQFFGIGAIGPLWFFFHYIQSPLADFAARDWRLIDVAASRTALIAVIVGLTIPTVAMYNLADLTQRLQLNALWQTFPVTTLILHYLLRTLAVENTTKHDKIWNVEADLPYVRFGIRTVAAISALTFNWVRLISPSPFWRIFWPSQTSVMSALSSDTAMFDLVNGMALFLQIDEIACFTAAFFWLALLISDLKKENMVSISWLKAIVYAGVGTFLIGPGAVVAIAWLWREEVLATKNVKGAIVRRD